MDKETAIHEFAQSTIGTTTSQQTDNEKEKTNRRQILWSSIVSLTLILKDIIENITEIWKY